MPRNIIICCDGTDNQFGVCNTNVVRFAEIFVSNPASQIVYYDPGVGTLPDPRMLTRIGRKVSQIKALCFGTDLEEKVETAYTHLMEVCQPDDRIFLFGFSRGAYTARVLGGMLHAIGLLPAGNVQLIPYAMRLFSASRHAGDDDSYWEVLNNFRTTFARPVASAPDKRFPVHFLGLWDTVSSVGWVRNPKTYPFTAQNASVQTARHAVSLDERRCFFRQNLIKPTGNQDVVELWFPGVHSDVGGGYTEQDGGLWRAAFEWMLGEASIAGALLDADNLAKVRERSKTPSNVWAEPKHESLYRWWWVAEYAPKKQYNPTTKTRKWEFGRGRHRVVQPGAEMHPVTLERIRGMDYRPPNLTSSFVQRVKRMTSVSGPLPYEP
jgi:uncharacterized protein (DUF2235 family)